MNQFPPTGWEIYGLSPGPATESWTLVLMACFLAVVCIRSGSARACALWSFTGTVWVCLILLWDFGTPSLSQPRVPLDVVIRVSIPIVISYGVVRSLRANARVREDGGKAVITGLFAGLIFPGVPLFLVTSCGGAHDPARRTQCKNNLKQISLAMHNYYDVYGSFPKATSSTPPVSWRISVLPFGESSDVFSRYDSSLAWDSKTNLPLSFEDIGWFRCPSRPARTQKNNDGQWRTSYLAPVGPETIAGSSAAVSFRDIPDGNSNTIMVVEACGSDIVWSEPRDADLSTIDYSVNLPSEQIDRSNSLLSSYHSGVALAGFADGSVRVISEDTSPEILNGFLTRSGGEDVPEW